MSDKKEEDGNGVTIDPSITTDAYCVRCRAKHTIMDRHVEVMKNGKYAVRGQCSTCGKNVYKIVKTEEGKRLKAEEEEGDGKGAK